MSIVERRDQPLVLYSCVVDRGPLFLYQSLVWAQTLLDIAGCAPAQLLVHAVRGCDPNHLDCVRSLGVSVIEVHPVEGGNGYANKLVQLGSAALAAADFVVMCDCDIAFAADISSWTTGDAIRGKVVDAGRPNVEEFGDILELAGMPPQVTPHLASHAYEYTDALNWNGGLYIIPGPIFRRLGDEWPKWDRWMLERRALFTDGLGMYSDQVALALALRCLGVATEPLPATLNFPIHTTYLGDDREDIEPFVLHYHDRLDASGHLQVTGMRGVDRVIARVNNSIAGMPVEMRGAALSALTDWMKSTRPGPTSQRWGGRLRRLAGRGT